MPRFTMQDLLLAMTFVALGVGGCVWFRRLDAFSNPSMSPFLILLAAGASYGAGFGAILQQKKIGAFLGLLAIVVYLVIFAPAVNMVRE